LAKFKSIKKLKMDSWSGTLLDAVSWKALLSMGYDKLKEKFVNIKIKHWIYVIFFF
jgi:hypothetical protein